MKKQIIYAITMLCVLLSAACSTEEQAGPGGVGAMSMTISTTRAEGEETYNPMEKLVVRIWNSEGGLLRKYKSQEDIPARLELVAGDYKVTVEAGEAERTSFVKRFYKGENTFTVKAGETVNAKVVCKIQNTIAEVKYDKTIAPNFGENVKVWIAAGEAEIDMTKAIEDQLVSLPNLLFTGEGVGYFTMPEDVTTLTWVFEGQHNEREKVVKTGKMTGVEACNKYLFTFRYSADLPGFVGCFPVKVDPSTDDQDDTIIFSPDPTIAGIGFSMKEILDYIPGKTGELKYVVTTMGATSGVKVSVNGKTFDAFAGVPGASVERDGDYALTLTISNEVFTGHPGGLNTVTFNITDVDGGALTTSSQFRLQGIAATQASDYDLWNNTVTLRSLLLDPEVTAVKFGLRAPGGEWHEVDGVKGDDGNFSATLSAEWAASTNLEGLPVYKPVAGTGVFANNSYESRTIIYGNESRTTFTTAGGQVIPDGDMENGSLGCFSQSAGPFWGSGNNSMKKDLCTRGSYVGQQGSYCAYLKSSQTIGILASGNLFTGDFSFSGTTGTVKFGRKYDWEARPKALSVRYYASIGNVDIGSDKIAKGQPDKGRIYVVLIDWSTQHSVSSGTGTPSGMWNPAAAKSTDEGAIIACGSHYIQGKTAGSSMVSLEIPIEYYDKVTKPTGNYTLIISCACSAYGDYMNGCSSNYIYVDDFKWVY